VYGPLAVEVGRHSKVEAAEADGPETGEKKLANSKGW
jgi:hypothetical protein